MKIECVKKKLHEALSKTSRVVTKNPTLPILSCVLFEARGSTLTLQTTNLDVGLKIDVPVRVHSAGTVAVSNQIISNFIAQLPDSEVVVIESVDGGVSVSTKQISSAVKSFGVEDFPIIPEVTKEHVFKIPSNGLIKGLRSVWYSSATSSMKPELSSVYIHVLGSDLVFAATDSFRLAEKKVVSQNTKDIPNILLPFKNTAEAMHIFEDYKGDLEVRVNKNQIAIIAPGIYFTSRVIDGSFPDYTQIIPKEFKTEAVILKADLATALKVATIFSDTFSQVGFSIVPSKKTIEVKTESGTTGKSSTKIEAVLDGEELVMNFNHKYISDCLQSISGDSLKLGFSGPHKPMVIRDAGDKSFTYLVMPMNK
jgi:DNA polymerase-3 subunit beta